MRRPVALFGAVLLLTLAAAAIWIVVQAARRERSDPARCPDGTVAAGWRCCAPGQTFATGKCEGTPSSCPAGASLLLPEKGADAAGCVATQRRIRIGGGSLSLTPSDWEAEGEVQARAVSVKTFELDNVEVTRARWRACASRGKCAPLPAGEPGLPVTQVSAEEAERFCGTLGGRLPSGDEWLFAAAGSEGRRYPWGQTGLVCRRAVFGLADGPCANGATGPELAGARPDGKTASGLWDLAGNAAEWAREPDGSYRARGGSFRSKVAGELKSWSAQEVTERADHVGFRCAYDVSE